MLDARKQRILQVIVQQYIRAADPVGSEEVVRLGGLKASSATVRHEMAALEEMGLLEQPHTSAGRVPTDRGYRVYVDTLVSETRLASDERARLRRQVLSLAEEADRLIRQAARFLADETHYPSVVATVRPSEQVFRHLHLIPLDAHRVMPVLVTDAGVYEGQPAERPEGVRPGRLDQLSRWISRRLEGFTLGEITRGRLEALVGEAAHLQRLLEAVQDWVDRAIRLAAAGRVFVEGTPHLLEEPEFHQAQAASRVLSALERADLLQDLLRPVSGRDVWVAIGSEMAYDAMHECSIVGATYHTGGRPMGTLAVLGPRRLRYDRALPLVRLAAAQLSETLTKQSA